MGFMTYLLDVAFTPQKIIGVEEDRSVYLGVKLEYLDIIFSNVRSSNWKQSPPSDPIVDPDPHSIPNNQTVASATRQYEEPMAMIF